MIWLGFLLASLLGGFGWMMWRGEQDRAMHRLDRSLTSLAADLAEEVRQAGGGGPPGGFGGGPRRPFDDRHEWPPPPPERGEPPPRGSRKLSPSAKASLRDKILAFEKSHPGILAGAYLKGSDEWIAGSQPEIAVGIPARVGRESRGHVATMGRYRVFHIYTELGDGVVVGSDLAGISGEMRTFLSKLVLIAGAALIVGMAGSWVLVGWSLRPVDQISLGARKVADGNLSERIEVTNWDSEIGGLAGVLNSTFSRLEESFEQQKRFISDASHELRTPLTVLITENQSTLSRFRTADEYRETVEENLKTAIQMKRLAESLLELARLDSNQGNEEAMPFEIGEVLNNCMTRMRVVAEAKEIHLKSNVQGIGLIHASPVRVAMVVNNLLENAIHYTNQGGTVTLSAYERGEWYCIEIEDNGCGIQEEHLPHIFNRFYRTDASRNRDVGRYGLGLTICKAMVEAEHGTISVRSKFGEGTTMTVCFPLDSSPIE